MDKQVGLYSTRESHLVIKWGELVSTTVWINLMDTKLSERHQSQKRPYCRTPFIEYSRTGEINWAKEKKKNPL